MNFVAEKQLTNVRPDKSDVIEVSLTPTTGTIRLSAGAATKMGVISGDYIGAITGKLNGQPAAVIYKGSEGDENTPNDGSKLASANKKLGGSLTFSSANTWDTLGGNENKVVTFTLDLEEAGEIEHPVTKKKIFAYPLKHVRTEDKTVRQSSETEVNA